MTYEDFMNLPVYAINDLHNIFCLKSKYSMDFTSEEKQIMEHFLRFEEEQEKSKELWKQKNQLEKLFKK